MTISSSHLDALKAFGYTEPEARFLYLVATHSGYFVARQFLGFTGCHWGKRTTTFWAKLHAQKQVRTECFPKSGVIYHLFSRRLYRQIGRENLRNRREHEIEFIRQRIAMLDFVLADPERTYLESEPEKFRSFCEQLRVPSHFLLARTYHGQYNSQPTIRYFVDKLPMFVGAEPLSSPVVTFTFIQGSEANMTEFVHHLEAYLPLFRQVSEFRFLYLARTDSYFRVAKELFDSLVTIPLQSDAADDIVRYCEIRKTWDLRLYSSLSEADLIFRNRAKARFVGDRFEHLYRDWKSGRVPDESLRTGWVFVNPSSGKPWWPHKFVRFHLRPAAEKAGIGRIGWHTFRHTYSTLLHAYGTDMKVQQELLRHSDIRTTMNIYTHTVSLALREANSKVVRMILPAGKTA